MALRNAKTTEITFWLEWAGEKLLSSPISRPGPKQPRALWPDFPGDALLAYGYNNAQIRPAAPAIYELKLIDEILVLPQLISNITSRRIVYARSLRAPLTQRYIFTWSKLARNLSCDRRAVMRWYNEGVGEIARAIPSEQVRNIREFFAAV